MKNFKLLLTILLLTVITGINQQIYSQTNAGEDQEVCESFTQLNANNPSPEIGYWSTPGIATFVNETVYNTFVQNLSQGMNTLRWTVGVEFDEVVITNNSVSSNAGVDFETCNSTINLSAVAPPEGSGYWTQTVGMGVVIANSLDRQTQVTGLTGGIYIFTWIVVNGICSDTDEVVVINSSPTISNPSTPSPETCDGTGVLQANAPGVGETGLWTGAGGSVIDIPSNNNTTVSGMPLGVNTFNWTLTKGTNVTCTSSNTVNITNNEVVAQAGSDQIICVDFTNLSATPPGSIYPFQGTGSWHTANSSILIDNTIAETTLVSSLFNGNHIFTWTVTQGNCIATDDVLISNNSPFAWAKDGEVSCDGNITLMANEPVSGSIGTWTCYTAGVTFDNNTIYNTNAHNLVPGENIFEWTVTNSYCTDVVSITVNYIDPLCDAGGLQYICDNNTYMTAQDPSPGIGHWEVQIGSGTFENPTAFDTFVSNISMGTNMYKWSVNDMGCVETSTVTINNNLPIAIVGMDITTCLDAVTLNAIQEQLGETAYWEKIAGTGIVTNSTQYNSSVTNLSPGINTFRWTVDNGLCINSDEVTIYNDAIVSINAGLDQNVCSSDATLNALATGVGESGVWDRISGGAIFANSAQFNTAVTNLSMGINQLSWTISNGTCEATDYVEITNNSPIPQITDPDQEICTSTITINATHPLLEEIGLWTNEFGAQGIIVDPSNSTTTVHSIGQGANTFRWTVSNNNGCSAYDDIIIINNTISTNAGLDQSRCEDTTVLAANNPELDTGWWELVNPILGPKFDNSLSYNTIVRNLSKGSNTFKWTVTNGTCSAWDLVTISNNLPDDADAGLDQIVCDGNATLSANNPNVGTGVWTMLGGAGVIANASNYNTDVTELAAGGNTFRWEIKNEACSTFDDIYINVV